MVPHEWLMAEVDELARNKARACAECRRRARFWPPRVETLVRAAGRGWSDRCETCVLAPNIVWSTLHNERPSAEARHRVRRHQAEQVMLQIEEIDQLPPSAECEQALAMLYLQLQLLADEIFNERLGFQVISGGRAWGGWPMAGQPVQ